MKWRQGKGKQRRSHIQADGCALATRIEGRCNWREAAGELNDEMKNELAEADGGLEHGHGIACMDGGAARGASWQGWRGQGFVA
ncbi:hypothetical protein BRADI_1g55272v3 [Brachypodium distachyon]|uniref:Uncharacterized protein n=1 Tax=Brachypodium distachyon TaxID=15368 RepID=A0A2K2DRI1_BRADI|nr:hypothetical protein BRADI_1g55272v3 [Brachypodium distachyon]